jgi:hypothetical protein
MLRPAPKISFQLSRLGEEGVLDGGTRRRLYLNEVDDRGPGPLRRGGTVAVTH